MINEEVSVVMQYNSIMLNAVQRKNGGGVFTPGRLIASGARLDGALREGAIVGNRRN